VAMNVDGAPGFVERLCFPGAQRRAAVIGRGTADFALKQHELTQEK
jgi:hypothetical protein